MTTLLQQFGTGKQISPADSRNIMLLTILSKLVMALVMGVFATVLLLIL